MRRGRAARSRRSARRAPMLGALVLLSGVGLSGCAPLFVTCSMPSIRPPHIEVDAAGWHQAYPGGTVHACYDGHCDQEDGTTSSIEIVLDKSYENDRRHSLAVTITDGSGTTTQSTDIALVRIPGQNGAPCPMPDQWSRIVLVRVDGRLQAGGADDGHIVVPTP